MEKVLLVETSKKSHDINHYIININNYLLQLTYKSYNNYVIILTAKIMIKMKNEKINIKIKNTKFSTYLNLIVFVLKFIGIFLE